jgi:hypothetical protein
VLYGCGPDISVGDQPLSSVGQLVQDTKLTPKGGFPNWVCPSGLDNETHGTARGPQPSERSLCMCAYICIHYMNMRAKSAKQESEE